MSAYLEHMRKEVQLMVEPPVLATPSDLPDLEDFQRKLRIVLDHVMNSIRELKYKPRDGAEMADEVARIHCERARDQLRGLTVREKHLFGQIVEHACQEVPTAEEQIELLKEWFS